MNNCNRVRQNVFFYKVSHNKYILHCELVFERSISTGGRMAAKQITTIPRKIMNKSIFCLNDICLEGNLIIYIYMISINTNHIWIWWVFCIFFIWPLFGIDWEGNSVWICVGVYTNIWFENNFLFVCIFVVVVHWINYEKMKLFHFP